MILKNDLIKITDYLWEIPKNYKAGMLMPARLYADSLMLDEITRDKSLEQLINLTFLPGILKYSLAMPDCHEGYASPIGGVVAVKTESGVISPGVCGYDINCGIKLLKSNIIFDNLKPYLEKLANEIYNNVPSGLGRGRKIEMGTAEIDEILRKGAKIIVENGYGAKEDLDNCEANGCLDFADSSCVSLKAKSRGQNQVGTLGSGNHFLEIQKVSEIFDCKAAENFGLFLGQVVVMIHTGSRGLGHQIATDYIKEFMVLMDKYNLKFPDNEFAAAPFLSFDGQRYFKAMACGANFAWANRQMITYFIRKSWQKALKGIFSDKNAYELKSFYDVAHNIIKKERYEINGKTTEMIVHRKGATRALPAFAGALADKLPWYYKELPEQFRNTGQPVLIPGSMGTASYVLAGQRSAEESFYSVCHGAGRAMSRHAALKVKNGKDVAAELKKRGIILRCFSLAEISEEAPYAYKDIDAIVDVVDKAGLSKKVAKMTPIAVIKG